MAIHLRRRVKKMLPSAIVRFLRRTFPQNLVVLEETERGPERLKRGLWTRYDALYVPVDHPEVVHIGPGDPEAYDEIQRIFPDLNSLSGYLRRLEPHFLRLADVSLNNPGQPHLPYLVNGWFEGDDPFVATAMVHELRPRTIIEIGSGNSTKFFRKAVTDAGLKTKLVSIDPSPRTEIDAICDEVHRKSLVAMKVDFFDLLEAGDILFLDGSHLVLQGTDCPWFFLRLLPRIKPGVMVHIHDIFLPREYAPAFENRAYSEQYLLGAFLLGNQDWTVRGPVAYLNTLGVLKRGFKFLDATYAGASLKRRRGVSLAGRHTRGAQFGRRRCVAVC